MMFLILSKRFLPLLSKQNRKKYKPLDEALISIVANQSIYLVFILNLTLSLVMSYILHFFPYSRNNPSNNISPRLDMDVRGSFCLFLRALIRCQSMLSFLTQTQGMLGNLSASRIICTTSCMQSSLSIREGIDQERFTDTKRQMPTRI